MTARFVHLRLHSEFSLTDSTVRIDELVAACAKRGMPALALDPLRMATGAHVAEQALSWADEHLAQGPGLIYSTADADDLKRVQQQLGVDAAGAMVERTLAQVAQGLVQRGVGQLIVAGGETSGACVQALQIAQLRIGPQIDPGVPWCHAALPGRQQAIHIALKSGNFGSDDFFTKAFGVL